VIQKGHVIRSRVEKTLRRDFLTLVMQIETYDAVYGARIGAS
jgi:hypothetical protein